MSLESIKLGSTGYRFPLYHGSAPYSSQLTAVQVGGTTKSFLSSSDLGKNENQISSICHIELPSGTYDLPGCEYVWNRSDYLMTNFHSYPYSDSTNEYAHMNAYTTYLSENVGIGIHVDKQSSSSHATTINFPNACYYRTDRICKYEGYCNPKIRFIHWFGDPYWVRNGVTIGNGHNIKFSGELCQFNVLYGYSGLQGFPYNFKINGTFNYCNGNIFPTFNLWFQLPLNSNELVPEPFSRTWVRVAYEQYSHRAYDMKEFSNVNTYFSAICTPTF